MAVDLHKGERLRIDDIVWSVDRRVPKGIQLISVGDGTFRILNESELVTAFFAGRIERLRPSLTKDDHAALNPQDRDFIAYSVKERDTAKRRCRYLDELSSIAGTPPYSTDKLRRALAQIAESTGGTELPPSVRTMRRWIARDKRTGSDVRAQVPRFFNRGNRGKRFPEQIQETAKNVLNELLMRPSPASIKESYSIFVYRLAKQNSSACDTSTRIPSLATFYRWGAELCDEDRLAAQHGRRTADAKYLAVKNGPAETIPLAAVEIDHTFVDCLVVDEQGQLLGRPTLTVAIDRATRMCTGFALTWEPPSYQCVMLTLKHMIRDKSYLKDKFGDTIQHDWPCFGLPRTIVIDNGMEFHSRHLKDACLQLGRISLEYTPTRSPRHKGKVERFFRTLNDQLFHLLPGTTLSRVDRNSDYDPTDKATVTLTQLNLYIHKFIVDIYSRSFHLGINDIPVEAWKRGVSSHPLRLPEFSKDLDILACGIERRVIGRQGIELFSLFYQCPDLNALRVRGKGNITVDVRYDPTDISTIWVANPYDGRHIAVPCNAQSYASGFTLWQHNKVLEHLRGKKRGATQHDLHKAKTELRELIETSSGSSRNRKRTRKDHARFLEKPSTPDLLANRISEPATAPQVESVSEQQTAPTFSPPSAFADDGASLQELIRREGFEVRQREW